MSPEQRRAIASKGGKAAQTRGTAHNFTPQEAAAAARKGHALGVAHKYTSAEAKVAGSKGGTTSAERRKLWSDERWAQFRLKMREGWARRRAEKAGGGK